MQIEGEAGAYDALMGNLRQAEEAARAGSQRAMQMRLHDAIEAATEIGLRLSDGRWSNAAIILDRARDQIVKCNPNKFRSMELRRQVGDRLAEIRTTLAILRHGRVNN